MLHSFNFLLGNHKCFLESIEHFLAWRVLFAKVVATKLLLHLVLHVEGQPVLEETADLAAILTVTIADGEEVAMFQAHDVRGRDVRILIRLVRVVRRYTALGRERELRHHVAYLVLLGLGLRLATSGRRVVLRLAVACLITGHVFALF